MADIKVYGADWCPLTKNTRAHLDELEIPYKYINIDHDKQAAKWVADQNDGKEKKPTLDIDGQVLTEPTDEELDEALEQKGILQ
jgi:glutaredoxin